MSLTKNRHDILRTYVTQFLFLIQNIKYVVRIQTVVIFLSKNEISVLLRPAAKSDLLKFFHDLPNVPKAPIDRFMYSISY